MVVPMVLVMSIIPVIIKKDHVKLKGAPSPKGIHSQLNLSFEKKNGLKGIDQHCRVFCLFVCFFFCVCDFSKRV